MSDTLKPAHHGREHCPGGEDPIPCLGGPIVFRAAVGDIADPEADRVHYVPDDEGNNIYWDTWDTGYDTSVFDTSLYEQTNDVDEGLVIAGVALIKRGLYSIHAIADVDEPFNGVTLFKSNYDEGQGEFRAHNNAPDTGEPYYGDLYGIRLDHWRFVEHENTDTTFPHVFQGDALFGGEAETVEIVLSINAAVTFPGITPGKFPLGGPYDPAGEFWIPGGYGGAWGLVPNLLVAYWGDPTAGDSTWLAGAWS